MDNIAHKQIGKVKKLFICLSMIMLIVSILLTSLFIYLGFAEPHNDDFCDLVQTRYDSDYDFVLSEGIGCKLLLSGWKQSIAVFLAFCVILQAPIWITYYIVKAFKKNHA